MTPLAPLEIVFVRPVRVPGLSGEQRQGTWYTAPSKRTSARGETVTNVGASATKGSGNARKATSSTAKRLPIVSPVRSRPVSRRASIRASGA